MELALVANEPAHGLPTASAPIFQGRDPNEDFFYVENKSYSPQSCLDLSLSTILHPAHMISAQASPKPLKWGVSRQHSHRCRTV